MSPWAFAQVIEHDDEEAHASFSPLSTGASLRSFPGTPLAAPCSEDSSGERVEALGSSQGTSSHTPLCASQCITAVPADAFRACTQPMQASFAYPLVTPSACSACQPRAFPVSLTG